MDAEDFGWDDGEPGIVEGAGDPYCPISFVSHSWGDGEDDCEEGAAFVSHSWADVAGDDRPVLDAEGRHDDYDTWASLDHSPAYVHVPMEPRIPSNGHQHGVPYRPLIPPCVSAHDVASVAKRCRHRTPVHAFRHPQSAESRAHYAEAAKACAYYAIGEDVPYPTGRARADPTRRPHRKNPHRGPWWGTRSRRPKRQRDEAYCTGTGELGHGVGPLMF